MLLLRRHLAGLAPLGVILRTLVRLVRTNPYVVLLLRFQVRDLPGCSGSLCDLYGLLALCELAVKCILDLVASYISSLLRLLLKAEKALGSSPGALNLRIKIPSLSIFSAVVHRQAAAKVSLHLFQ